MGERLTLVGSWPPCLLLLSPDSACCGVLHTCMAHYQPAQPSPLSNRRECTITSYSKAMDIALKTERSAATPYCVGKKTLSLSIRMDLGFRLDLSRYHSCSPEAEASRRKTLRCGMLTAAGIHRNGHNCSIDFENLSGSAIQSCIAPPQCSICSRLNEV